jgi:LPS-assembly protein
MARGNPRRILPLFLILFLLLLPPCGSAAGAAAPDSASSSLTRGVEPAPSAAATEAAAGQPVPQDAEGKPSGAQAPGALPACSSGIVMDPRGAPLAGVQVEILNRPEIRSRTDEGGRFSIAAPPGEPFLLRVTREGHLPLYLSCPAGDGPRPAALPRHILYPDPGASPPPTGREGPVEVEADRFRFVREPEAYLADGNVLVTYESTILVAEKVRIDRSTDEASAEGHVLILGNGDVLEGDRGTLRIQAKTGVMYDGRLFLAKNHFYVRGDRIEKLAESTYRVENAAATPCDGEIPDWRFTGRELDVTLDGYGKLYHGRFEVRKLPVIYAPFLMFPAKTTRQSGFLLPYLSYSRDRLGVDVQVPFYWAAAKNIDATLYTRAMTQRGVQEGLEVRYVTAGGSFGTIYGDALDDRKRVYENMVYKTRDWQPGQRRWALWWNHETRFDNQSYIRADIAKVSDSWYFRDFSSHNYFLDSYASTQEDRFRRVSFLANESLTQLDSTVRYVRDWSNANLTAAIRYTDDFMKSSNAATLQRYPEISFTATKQPLLATPLYYEFAGVYDYYYRNTGQKGHLMDVHPVLSLPTNLFGRVQFTPSLGWQGTFWSRDDDTALTTDTRRGERQLFQAGGALAAEVQRIYTVNWLGVEKIRHAMKPEITYSYMPNAYQSDIPDFVSTIGEQHSVTYAVTNTLTARSRDKEGKVTYREWARFKLSQTYSILEARRTVVPGEKENRPFGDVIMELDLTPFSYLGFTARNKLDVNGGGWRQSNYDLNLSDGRGDTLTVGYRYTRDTLDAINTLSTTTTSGTTSGALEELNLMLKVALTRSLDLTYVHRRNLLDNKDVERTYGIRYRRQCWEIQVSFSDNVTYMAAGSEEPDRTFSVKLSLYGL